MLQILVLKVRGKFKTFNINIVYKGIRDHIPYTLELCDFLMSVMF